MERRAGEGTGRAGNGNLPVCYFRRPLSWPILSIGSRFGRPLSPRGLTAERPATSLPAVDPR